MTIGAAFVALARWSVEDSLEPDRPFEEAIRHRYAGLIRDTVVDTRPWGFSPTGVSVPVSLWHGVEDGEVPLAHAEANARILPRSTPCVREGEDHFLSVETWQQVLAERGE